jgi:hypothetical protein
LQASGDFWGFCDKWRKARKTRDKRVLNFEIQETTRRERILLICLRRQMKRWEFDFFMVAIFRYYGKYFYWRVSLRRNFIFIFFINHTSIRNFDLFMEDDGIWRTKKAVKICRCIFWNFRYMTTFNTAVQLKGFLSNIMTTMTPIWWK